MTDLIYARKNENLVETLLKRRSASAKAMGGDAIPIDDVKTMLAAAMRVPDHGKLNPWWFITFEGDARAEFGEIIKAAWAKREAQATPEKLADEAKRFLRAPLVIAVISSPRESLIPVWEQVLSAGAACHNLCLAANALGYGANWLTEWYAYDPAVRDALKLAPHENVAGFIYVGTPTKAPEERDRPTYGAIVNNDFKNAVSRGHQYAKEGLGYILTGIDPSVYQK